MTTALNEYKELMKKYESVRENTLLIVKDLNIVEKEEVLELMYEDEECYVKKYAIAHIIEELKN